MRRVRCTRPNFPVGIRDQEPKMGLSQEAKTITAENGQITSAEEPTEVQLQVIKDRDEFSSLAEEWDSFVSRAFNNNPFYLHFWFDNYLTAFYPNSQPLTVLVRDESGQLIGLAPMVSSQRKMAGLSLKEARLIAGEHSHINGLLIRKDQPFLWHRIVEAILKEGVDLIYLEDLPDEFPSQRFIEDYCTRKKMFLECHSLRQSPYIPSTGTFEDYRKTALSKKFRELLNNRRNRLKKHGEYRIESITGIVDFDKTIEAMRKISVKSWQHENGTGLFTTPECEQFYTDLMRHALDNQYGQVHILYIESDPAAYEFHIIHQTTEYCLKVEYDQNYSKLSPGGVLDLELVMRAFESDIETYDLLGDASDYKLRWTKDTVPYYRYFAFGRTAAARLASMANYKIGNVLRKSTILMKIKNSLSG